MEPFRYHLYICEQQKPEGLACCSARGSKAVADALRREIAARGLFDQVQITSCGSLGLCEHGPNLVVYPEGVWYSDVHPEDVPEIVQSHFVEGRPVERLVRRDAAALAEEIRGNRDRYLAAVRAHEAAGAVPDDLMQTIRAFQESRVILTALELDLFTAVGDGARANEIAAAVQADPRATGMLLHALVSLGLLTKQAGMFRCTPAAARYFDARSPVSARMAMLHFAGMWKRWSTLTQAVRTGSAVQEGAPEGQALWTEAFIAAMHYNAAERAPLVARAAGPARRLLDVGGGSGAYSIAFAQAFPELTADILDRPEVLAIAHRHIEAAGLGARVRTRPGDLTAADLGSGYDTVLVSAICHMLSPGQNLDLLRRCRKALLPGGRVVIQDFILNPDKTGPRSAALFSLNMLVATESGASYSEEEYRVWLREAGFASARRVNLAGPTDLIIGLASEK